MLNAVTSDRPNPQHPRIRELVEQERLEEILAGLGVSAHKLDKITEGLANTIAIRPEVFPREPATGWSRILVNGFPPDVPSLRIWFTYDDEHIYVEHVETLE